MFRGRSVSVGTQGEPEYAYGSLVSRDFFRVFGTAPLLGRGFTTDEVESGATPVVVLSEGLWARGFVRDPAILGKTLPVDGITHTIVGVMPDGFNAPGEWVGPTVQVALWRPLSVDLDHQRGNRSYSAIARLGDGGTLESARLEMTGIYGRLQEEYPEANAEWIVQVFPWSDLVVDQERTALWLFLAVMTMVLLIVCANVAALAVDRVLARGRELATRVALGASRGRLVRLVFTELSGLVMLGGMIGLLAARGALAAFRAYEPGLIPRLQSVSIDLSVLVYAMALTALVAAVVGSLAVVLALRGQAMNSLRTSGGGVSWVGGRTRSALTISQFVVSFALLAGALLLVHSHRDMARTDLGFEGVGVTAMTVALSWDRVETIEDRSRFTRDLLSELERSQLIETAAMINSLPLSGSRQLSRITIGGITEPGREPAMAIRGVSDGYHQLMGIPIQEGRALVATDVENADVALLNRVAAEAHWEGASPIGSQIEVDGHEYTVVGVMGNVLHGGPNREVLSEVYLPYSAEFLTSKSYVVRGTGEPEAVQAAMREALKRVDPAQPIREIRSMESWAAIRTAPSRFLAGVMATAAVLATILAGVGLFGAMAGLVRERRKEIAVRMAVGADGTSVVRLMATRALVLVGPGLGLGLVLALALGRVIQGMLFGVGPGNAGVLGTVALLLTGVSLVAVVVPTLRARAVQPVKLLREE